LEEGEENIKAIMGAKPNLSSCLEIATIYAFKDKWKLFE